MYLNIFIGILCIIIAFTLTPSFSEVSTNIEDFIEMGIELDESEQYEEALIHFDKILELDPDNVGALNEKGVILLKLDQFEEAISYFDRALILEPQNREIQLNWETAYGKLQRDEIDGFVTIESRDSRGRLIAYIEGHRVQIIPHSSTYELINTFNLKEVITLEEQEFNVFVKRHDFVPVSVTYIASITMPQLIHDIPSYPIVSHNMPGFFYQMDDSVIFDWVILIPV